VQFIISDSSDSILRTGLHRPAIVKHILKQIRPSHGAHRSATKFHADEKALHSGPSVLLFFAASVDTLLV
jgi:hypothetical protein